MPAWFLPLIAAPFVGSFLGVLIRRLPRGRPVVAGRSACEACGRAISPAGLIPLVSYMALRGRCRWCRGAISAFHPAVELAALAIALCCLWLPTAMIWPACALGWTLLALAWIDWEHMRLPDVLTLPLLLAGLAVTWVLAPDDLADHAIASAIGYLAFRGIALGYRALRGREGMGAGDAKLLAAGGAWLGTPVLALVVAAGAMFGIAVALLQAGRGARMEAATAVPFGPGLALAIWLGFLWQAASPTASLDLLNAVLTSSSATRASW